ncbi:hypothetical protein EJB05_58126, partial [Eragrostis curvula]
IYVCAILFPDFEGHLEVDISSMPSPASPSAPEDGAREAERWEGYVDWRNRPATKGRHGGMLAASFVLVVEVLENLAFLANASNLSATTVTNFMGTAFLLALLGGFLSDAFFTTYAIYLVSAFVEFMVRSTRRAILINH